MASRPDTWPELRTLFAAYLNQDFPDDHGTPENAVKAFCRESSAQQLTAAADEVRDILGGTEDEDATLRTIKTLGLEYHPEAEGWTMRDWLAELERVLRDPSRPTTLNWPLESRDG